jgi:hypothetical protein
MRWPFQSKKANELRVFRDGKTNEIILRIVGPLCLPSPESPIQLNFTATVEYQLDQEAVQRLYEQLRYFARPELASGLSTADAGLTGDGTKRPNSESNPP